MHKEPLLDAILNNDEKGLKLLIAEGVNVNETSLYGTTALSLAAHYGRIDCLNTLLAAKADPNIDDHEGRTALISAATNNKILSINILIAAKANINPVDAYGKTALSLAAYHGYADCLNALISAGANPNIADSKGLTPLHHTAISGGKGADCVSALIAARANVNLKDHKNQTALEYSCHHYYIEAGDYRKEMALLIAGASPGYSDSLYGAKYLLKCIKSCDIRDRQVRLALTALCEQQKALTKKNLEFDLTDQEIKETETYVKKLQQAEEVHKQNVFNAIDEGTASVRQLPTVLIDLIAKKDLSCETPLKDDRVVFKEAKDLDALLTYEKSFFANTAKRSFDQDNQMDEKSNKLKH